MVIMVVDSDRMALNRAAKLSDLSGSELLQKILRYQPLAEGRILQKNEEILGSPLNSDLV